MPATGTKPISSRASTRPDGKSVYSNRFANGAQCSVPMLYRQPAPSCVMDSRSNLLISNDSTENTNSGSTNQYTESWDTNHTVTYDAAGRQWKDTSQTCSVTQSTDSAFPVAQAPKITSTRTYDADNHLTGQTIPIGYEPTANDCTSLVGNPTYWNAMSFGYTWGPDGHLAQIAQTTVGNGTQTSTTGWDGDDLLYQSEYGWTNIAIEKLGIFNGTNFSIYDRDWSGSIANVHEAGGYTAVQTEPWRWRCNVTGASHTTQGTCTGTQRVSQGAPSDPDFNAMALGIPALSSQRSDGYSDAFNTFQGVRAYDPNMNQWTTPDAYAGDVHDPMSQKPYMWNGNNPVAYSDPSGYESAAVSIMNAPGVSTHTNAGVYVKVEGNLGPLNVGFAATLSEKGSTGYFIHGGAISASPLKLKSTGGLAQTFGGLAAGGLRGNSVKTFIQGVANSFKGSASVSAGVVLPNAGQTTESTFGGETTSLSATARLGAEVGHNSSGNSIGLVLSLSGPGASVNVSTATPTKTAPIR